MYNYSIELTYLNNDDSDIDTSTLYRKEMLDVFKLEQYNDSVVIETIHNLFLKYKDNPQIKDLLKLNIQTIPFEVCDETKFVMLFSYEHFFYMHKCLQYLDNNKDIEQNILDKLKKNIQKK